MIINKNHIVLLAVFIAIVGISSGYLVFYNENNQEEFPVEFSEVIKLPEPLTNGKISVEQAIQQRRSVRDFTEESLKLEEVSQILWAAQGITEQNRGYRSAPSAGATYPLDLYLVVKKDGVIGLKEGVYLYNPFEHKLENILKEDLSLNIKNAALGQSFIGDAPINIVITGVYDRTTSRYGERGKRYVHMEVGHVGQNIYLQAESLGLGTVVVGAFDDRAIKEILNLPQSNEPFYIIPVGNPKN